MEQIRAAIGMRGDILAWAERAPPEEIAMALEQGKAWGEKARALGLWAPAAPAEGAGRAGEAAVLAALRGRHRLQSSAGKPHGGDFTTETAAGPVLIEVKNYTRTVPTAEVEKFMRDLRDRQGAGGLFISVGAPIARMPRMFDLSLEASIVPGRRIPVIYVGGAPPEGVAFALDAAVALAEAFAEAAGEEGWRAAASAVEALAEGAGDIRAALSALGGSIAGELSSAADKAARLRGRAGALAEEMREAARGAAAAPAAAAIAEKYSPDAADIVEAIVGALDAQQSLGGVPAGARWRLGASRATFVATGVALAFPARGRAQLCIPAGQAAPRTAADLIAAHGDRVDYAGGEIRIQLEESTREVALGLARGELPRPSAAGDHQAPFTAIPRSAGPPPSQAPRRGRPSTIRP